MFQSIAKRTENKETQKVSEEGQDSMMKLNMVR